MSAQHTPWRIDEDQRPGMNWNRHILDVRGHAVCFMAHSDGKDPEGDLARARLLAAAPDLLAALDEMLDDIGRANSMPSAVKARAAIAKATAAIQERECGGANPLSVHSGGE